MVHEKSYELRLLEGELRKIDQDIEKDERQAANSRNTLGIRLAYRFAVVPLGRVARGIVGLRYSICQFNDRKEVERYNETNSKTL